MEKEKLLEKLSLILKDVNEGLENEWEIYQDKGQYPPDEKLVEAQTSMKNLINELK